MSKKVLSGHTSPETAFTVEDYPYSFKLRCRIRYWIETKKGFGQRPMSQTTNPRKPLVEVWNKPKAGIYHAITILYQDSDSGHVHTAALTVNSWAKDFAAFRADYQSQLEPDTVSRLDSIERISRKYNPSMWAEHDAAAQPN